MQVQGQAHSPLFSYSLSDSLPSKQLLGEHLLQTKAVDGLRCKQKPILQARRALALPQMQRTKPTLQKGLPLNLKAKEALRELIALNIPGDGISIAACHHSFCYWTLWGPEIMPKTFSVCSMNKSEYTCLIDTCIVNIIKTGLLLLGPGQ